MTRYISQINFYGKEIKYYCLCETLVCNARIKPYEHSEGSLDICNLYQTSLSIKRVKDWTIEEKNYMFHVTGIPVFMHRMAEEIYNAANKELERKKLRGK